MIRLADTGDLEQILLIVKDSVERMGAEGNPQWSSEYPARKDFHSDIESNTLFVYEKKDVVCGFICINKTEPPEYANVSWNSDERHFVLHRLAVDLNYRRSGIGQELMEFAESYAKGHNTTYLRTDTFSGNRGMNGLFNRCGYHKTGEVYFRNIVNPFFCYDKLI